MLTGLPRRALSNQSNELGAVVLFVLPALFSQRQDQLMRERALVFRVSQQHSNPAVAAANRKSSDAFSQAVPSSLTGNVSSLLVS